MNLNLVILPKVYCILKFESVTDIPPSVYTSDFYSITRTPEEISVITEQKSSIKENIVCEKDWRILKIDGILNFSMVGIISDITSNLKEDEIPVFVISTFNTDCFLVKQNRLNEAIKALEKKGHSINYEK